MNGSYDAYEMYVAVFGDRLNEKQRHQLEESVMRWKLSKTAWRDALENWKLNGYSPRNIAGMVEYAAARPAGNRGPTLHLSALVDSLPDPELEVIVIRAPTQTFAWE